MRIKRRILRKDLKRIEQELNLNRIKVAIRIGVKETTLKLKRYEYN